MDVIVPFAATEPKTRLDGLLTSDERVELANAMLEDVCTAISSAGGDPTVVSTTDIDCSWPVVVDDRPLTPAINARLDPPVAVVMADLALATTEALGRFFAADGDVVIAPGLGGGTNALVVRHGDFYTDYHGMSVADHRRIADETGAETTVIDSFRLAVDIDEPADLVELALHGEGSARRWLENAALSVDPGAEGKRPTVKRDR